MSYGDRIDGAVATLAPGYFALVMASGVISVGLHLGGFDVLSMALLVVAAVAFLVLVVLTTWRLLAHRDRLVADLTDPRRGFGFFTLVAAADVLGVRFGGQGLTAVTAGLLVFALAAWVALGYVVPWAAVLGRTERPVLASANGTWFIWVVAGESIATASATLQPTVTLGRSELTLVAVLTWSVGLVLYGAVGVLVFLRALLYPFRPEDLQPPYWVSMGAVAITVLAATRIAAMQDAPMLTTVRPLLAGEAVLLWDFATWLVPVLVALGWWRHRVRKVSLVYDATLWSIVFPLGMYSVASMYLGRTHHLADVAAIGSVGIWVAFAAWLTVLVAMAGHLWNTVLTGPG